MPKTDKMLTEIRKTMNSIPHISMLYSYYEDESGKLRELIQLFKDVEDSRMINKCKYSTATVVGIVFLGILGGMDAWTEIEDFAEFHIELIRKYVDLEDDIPSHDTLKRVFSLINTSTLEKTLVEFLKKSIETTASILNIDKDDMKHMSIDGKEVKGSGRKYNTEEKIRNTQIMNFYDSSMGICIRSELIDSKTNEIPTAQRVLGELNIKGFIITSDAMNCQKDTVDVIVKGKGHYVLGLKGNHGDFHNEIKEKFKKDPKKGKSNYYCMETEKNHNQVEKREFYKISADKFVYADEWNKIKNVIMYKKTIINNFTGEEKKERRYYITDLNDIKVAGEAIRRHWSVENELHWHLDVNLSEDDNTTIDRRAVVNLSIIKKTILTMMKLMQPIYGNKSIRRIRKRFTYGYEESLLTMFAFLDEEKLKQIISEGSNNR